MEIVHLLADAGSTAYGFRTPESDHDTRGIMWRGTLSHVLGFERFDVHEQKDPDTVLHSLPKFMTLMMSGSFNALDLLWVPQDMVTHQDQWGQELRDIRRTLIGTERLRQACLGFAHGQFQFVSRNRPEARAKREGTIVLDDYDKQYRKAQHHSLRVLWQATYYMQTGIWPVKVSDFDQQVYSRLMSIKIKALSFDEWSLQFRTAIDDFSKAVQSTSFKNELDTKFVEDYVIRYRLWLIKTIQDHR